MWQAKDIVGQRFGKLTVIKRVENNNRMRAKFLCRCDCGNEKIILGDSLSSGKTKSCGCLKHQTSYRFENLIGQKFGYLTVLERAENGKNGQTRYKCVCDCGKECTVLATSLKQGVTKSCGCFRRKEMSVRSFKDLTGHKFGRLTVLQRVESDKNRKSKYLCRCDCGNEKVVLATELRNGHTKSCGCLHKETSTERIVSLNTTHGQTKTRLYNILKGMKQRCYYPKSINYHDYGGRGITVCDEWLGENGFQNFYDWAYSNGYSDELSIDRIDNNGNYCPENCRWATIEEQANNKRKNVLYSYNGETLTLRRLAQKYNIRADTLQYRIKKLGWSVKDAIETPLQRKMNKSKKWERRNERNNF